MRVWIFVANLKSPNSWDNECPKRNLKAIPNSFWNFQHLEGAVSVLYLDNLSQPSLIWGYEGGIERVQTGRDYQYVSINQEALWRNKCYLLLSRDCTRACVYGFVFAGLFVCFDIMQTREIGCIYWIFPIGNSIK